MTAMAVFDVVCVLAALAAALVVVRAQNLNAAVMALSAVGVLLSVVFLLLDAPDVAQAEVVVGAITLPALYLLSIARIRAAVSDDGERRDLGEIIEAGPPGPDG